MLWGSWRLILLLERVQAQLLNILLEVSLKLVYVRVLLQARDLCARRVVEITHIVLFDLEFFELSLDLSQIHIYFI